MKKSILSALALATMVGACTNEEFDLVQSPAVPGEVTALSDRAKGELTLNAGRMDINDDATRVDGNIVDGQNSAIVNWFWRDGNDKLGGVVVDYAVGNNIVDKATYPAYAITNYPFAPKISAPSKGAEFSTPTAVVEGSYFFYSQYDGQNTSRRTISDRIERLQTVGYGREAGLVQIGSNQQDGGENFFISPIVYAAVADESDIETPLALTSAHAVLHVTLDADLENKYIGENGLSVHKIVLNNVGGSKFNLENTIDPAELGKRQKEAYDALPWDSPLKKTSPWGPFISKNGGSMMVVDGQHALAKEAQEWILQYLTEKSLPVPVIGTQSSAAADVTTDLVYQLEEPFVYTSSDAKMELFVILPAGTYQGKTGLKEYNGKTAGALRMTVYTSEGTYDCYIGKEDGSALTAHRNEKVNLSRTLKIKGGVTNINLFDPNEAFTIETTADYNYVIDYVNNHYRDFGNASDWKAPVLNFVAGKTINVDEAHLFPEFPVRYIGNATLNLTAENHEYKFNPYNVILGTGTDRPTIKIGDAGSSIAFTHNIKNDGKTTDGKDMTHALKLNADAKVIVANNQTVNFETLTSGTDMSVGESATVKVSGAASASGLLNVEKNAYVEFSSNATLNGKVFVKENADILAKNQFTNKSEMNVAPLAIVTLEQTASNSGKITLEGTAELYSKTNFTNSGTLLVMKCENKMNDKTRAKAEFVNLTNNGTITLEASVDKKGTYGAYVNVATKLINNRNAKVNNNGELNINTVENHGTITLEGDPYALISVDNGYYTDGNGYGSVVLADATEYEMYDDYYTGRNKLTGAGIAGVIETTIEKQETYDKILANYIELNSQENALEVLNKITVKCNLTVMNDELANVDFILNAENSALVAGENDLVINSLTANTKSSLSTKAGGNQKWNVTINKEVVTNANFEVTNKVNAIINSGYEYFVGTEKYGSLNIKAGTFTNNGSIVGTVDNKPVYTYIESNATLLNKASIGQTTGSTLNHYIIIRANKGTIDMRGNNVYTVGGIVDNTQGVKMGEFDVNVLESEHASIVGGIIGL